MQPASYRPMSANMRPARASEWPSPSASPSRRYRSMARSKAATAWVGAAVSPQQPQPEPQPRLVRLRRLRSDPCDGGLEPLPALAEERRAPPTALPRRRRARCRSPGRRQHRAPSRAPRERCRVPAGRWRASPHRTCAASRRSARSNRSRKYCACRRWMASISPASASFSSA